MARSDDSSSTSRTVSEPLVCACIAGTSTARPPIDAGQVDLKGCAELRFAIDPDASPALLDDAVDGGESQSGSPAASLGGEERLEDARLDFRSPCRNRYR